MLPFDIIRVERRVFFFLSFHFDGRFFVVACHLSDFLEGAISILANGRRLFIFDLVNGSTTTFCLLKRVIGQTDCFQSKKNPLCFQRGFFLLFGSPDRFRSRLPLLPYFREAGADDPFRFMHRTTGMDPPLGAGCFGNLPCCGKSLPQPIWRWLHLDGLIRGVPAKSAESAGFWMFKIVCEPFHQILFFLGPVTRSLHQDRWQQLFLFGSLPGMGWECWAVFYKPERYSVPSRLSHGSCLHKGSAALPPDLPHRHVV